MTSAVTAHPLTRSGPRSASDLIRSVLRRPARFVRRQVLPRLLPPSPGAPPPGPDAPVRVVGLLSSASGVGKSARLCIETLQRAGRDIVTADVSDLFGAGDGLSYPGAGDGAFTRGLTIFQLNPPMLLPAIVKTGPGRFYRSFNIGYWAWELEALPPEWIEALRFVDAVMVPSTFCAEAVRRATGKPVAVVPHPVREPPPAPAVEPDDRAGRFRVLTIFNFGSSFERKNPGALIEAFREAFGEDPGTELVLKTSRGARHPADLARLQAMVGGASNIRIVDEVWEEARVDALIRSSDVYASLHRSEGFGLTLAEAILLEVPVVATNWSGNVDFCDPALSYPVAYTLVPFSDRHTDYSQIADARWAEPSVADAARQLRRVREAPDAARGNAALLKGELIRYLATQTYERALDEIMAAAGRAPTAPRPPAPRAPGP